MITPKKEQSPLWDQLSKAWVQCSSLLKWTLRTTLLQCSLLVDILRTPRHATNIWYLISLCRFCIVYRDNSNAFVQFSSLSDWNWATATVDEMLVGILTLSSNTTVYKHFHLKYNTTSMHCSVDCESIFWLATVYKHIQQCYFNAVNVLWVDILTYYSLFINIMTWTTTLLQCSLMYC